MNDFFKLLRDFIIFIPLGILIFGIFFVLVIVGKDNLALLPIGLLIVLYGLIASYIRQIYKDYVHFLREEELSTPDYLAKWKKYHRYYYIAQSLLLGVFIYILWNFISMTDLNSLAVSIPSASAISSPFWQDFEFWSVIVLAITAFFLVRYTRATEQMAANQMMPAVDVNMIYDKQERKTYFWFLNASSIPALISMHLKVKGKKYPIGPLRIAPLHSPVSHFKKTATTYDFLEGNENEEVEAVLKILVKPALDNQKVKLSYTKNYRFNASRKEWDESTWSYPDLPFPQQE